MYHYRLMRRTRIARRHPLVTRVAALLLVANGMAGGSAGLVHAQDRLAAPATIEAEHGPACPVDHDPARCPVCQAVGVAALPEPSRATVAAAARAPRPLAPAFDAMPSHVFRRAAPPRAPPASLAV